MENKSSMKFMQREDAKLDAFQEEMNEFGLTVSRSIAGRYSDDERTFYIDMRTQPEPLKGNKGTVERLKAAGYVVAKTMHEEKNRRFYVFFVVKPDSIPTVGGSELTIDEREEPAEEPRTITKLELKERQAFADFQEEMTPFGLTVICDSTTRWKVAGGTEIGMVTDRLPVKGNKGLIERLEAAGYTVRRFSETARDTGKRFATFNVQKWAVVPAEDDDLQPAMAVEDIVDLDRQNKQNCAALRAIAEAIEPRKEPMMANEKDYRVVTARIKGTGWPVDGHILYLAKLQYDPEYWHLWGWDEEADEAVMETVWQTENEAGMSMYESKDEFVKAWKDHTWEAQGAFTFAADQVEDVMNIEATTDRREAKEADQPAAAPAT